MFRVLCSFLLLLCAASRLAYADTLTFDGFSSRDGLGVNLEHYGNFTVYLFDIVNPSNPPPFPNDNTSFIVSSYYPFQPPQYPYPFAFEQNFLDQLFTPSIYSTSGQFFTLNSMLVTTGYGPVPILGFRQGVLVDSSNTSAANPTTGLLTLNWSDIDAILFPRGIDFNDVVIDTIVINEPIAGATPEPSTIVFLGSGLLALVAAAQRQRFLHSVGHKMCS